MWPMLVVVSGVAGEDRCQMPFAGDQHAVGASRRTVPTKRSAKALARDARGGVLITSMPAALNTVSKCRKPRPWSVGFDH
jgi:hypothetical protein